MFFNTACYEHNWIYVYKYYYFDFVQCKKIVESNWKRIWKTTHADVTYFICLAEHKK